MIINKSALNLGLLVLFSVYWKDWENALRKGLAMSDAYNVLHKMQILTSRASPVSLENHRMVRGWT